MCGPVAIAVSLFSIQALAAYGQYEAKKQQAKMQKDASKAQAAQLDYRASLEERNAQMVEMEKVAVDERARQEKDKLSNRIKLIRGTGRAGYAGSGVVLGVGSPNDWEVDLGNTEAYDRDIIDYNAAWDNWSITNKAEGYRSQAKLTRYESGSVLAFGKAQYKSSTNAANYGLLAGIGNAAVSGLGAYSTAGGTSGAAGDSVSSYGAGSLMTNKSYGYGP
jgi:hypothetical protein